MIISSLYMFIHYIFIHSYLPTTFDSFTKSNGFLKPKPKQLLNIKNLCRYLLYMYIISDLNILIYFSYIHSYIILSKSFSNAVGCLRISQIRQTQVFPLRTRFCSRSSTKTGPPEAEDKVGSAIKDSLKVYT